MVTSFFLDIEKRCYNQSMKTLIWDFNGTILDDLQLCLSIENEMLKKRGMEKYPVSKQDYLNTFSFPVINYYYHIGYTFDTESYEEVSLEFNQEYDRRFDECSLMDDFITTIEKAIQLGYRNVILSASRHDKLVEQCKLLGIDQYFDEILGIDNMLAASKVEMAKIWMEKSDVEPSECKYIGDTVHDKEVAEALGIHDCVLIANGHQSYEVLRKVTDNVVYTLKEVTL